MDLSGEIVRFLAIRPKLLSTISMVMKYTQQTYRRDCQESKSPRSKSTLLKKGFISIEQHLRWG